MSGTRIVAAVLLLAVALGVFFPAAVRSPAATPPPLPSEAIKAVLDAQAAAWNKGDLDGFMAGYRRDKDLFYVSGAKAVRGWDALRDHYKAAYQEPGKEMGTLTFSDVEVEVFTPKAAHAHGRWKVTTKAKESGGWFTLVFREYPEGWRVTYDHTSGEVKK